jgi:hypothetical protein
MRIFELEICRSEDSGKFKRRYLLAAALLMSLPIRGLAQITIQPAGSLRIEGDSSLHKWSSTATVVTMTFQSKAGVPKSLPAAIKASKIETLEVVIPIAGLKSGESGLDRNLRKAMKVKQFPDVVYHLEHYQTPTSLITNSTEASPSSRTTSWPWTSGAAARCSASARSSPSPSPAPVTSACTSSLKEARMGFNGKYDDLFNYQIEFAYGGENQNTSQSSAGGYELMDFVADVPVKPLGENTIVKLGQFRVPYGREALGDEGYQDFGDRSIANLATNHGRDFGLAIMGTHEKWTGTLGTFPDGGRDIAQRYLPEEMGIPELVARFGYNDGVDADIYHVMGTDRKLTRDTKAFFINGLFETDTRIGHSTALQSTPTTATCSRTRTSTRTSTAPTTEPDGRQRALQRVDLRARPALERRRRRGLSPSDRQQQAVEFEGRRTGAATTTATARCTSRRPARRPTTRRASGRSARATRSSRWTRTRSRRPSRTISAVTR